MYIIITIKYEFRNPTNNDLLISTYGHTTFTHPNNIAQLLLQKMTIHFGSAAFCGLF